MQKPFRKHKTYINSLLIAALQHIDGEQFVNASLALDGIEYLFRRTKVHNNNKFLLKCVQFSSEKMIAAE